MALVNCRLCNSQNLVSALDLGEQSYTGIFPSAYSQDVPLGKLDLGICLDCSLVQLMESFDGDVMYGVNYGYKSSLNESMSEHLRKISIFLRQEIVLMPEEIIVDIGSNDGTLLSFFGDINKIKRVGVDPTIVKFEKSYHKDIIKIPKFFDKEIFEIASPEKAKLITSISMMYDLENPIKFAEDIFYCLRDDGYWFFEQSYLGLMIDKLAYDTICHEHIEYYSAATIKIILDRTGFIVEKFALNSTNGGSIAILAKKKINTEQTHCKKFLKLVEKERKSKLNELQTLKVFADNVKQHKQSLFGILHELVSNGKRVMALGASTKGNVLLQYCGLDQSMILNVGEINNDKFGHFTPGTNIPIISEEEVFVNNPDILLILPWHFRETFIKKTEKFRQNGGKVLFPLPIIEFVD